MASKTVPSTEIETLRSDLRDCDATTQSTVEQILAICGAAQARLAMDPKALADVHALLSTISDLSLNLENEVNATAEKHGCNYVDIDKAAVARRFQITPLESAHG